MNRIAIFACLLTLIITTEALYAETIDRRLGITGRIGFLIPADSTAQNGNISTDVTFLGGGGVIFGFDRNLAAECEITRTQYDASGALNGDFTATTISFGLQYRLDAPLHHPTPYIGGGFDIVMADFENHEGTALDVDTVVGIHLSGGIDYFIQKELALNAEAKLVMAPDADIRLAGTKVGNYDPMNINGTIGIRYFFN